MALYQVNGDLNEDYSDYERFERKALNPYYLYLSSCSNYHQMLKNSAKNYLQNIIAYDKTLRGNCKSGVAMLENKGNYKNIFMWVM